MQTTAASESSLFGLFRQLREEITTLIKQQVQLAKTELSEKASHAGRNAVGLAVGGVIAYGGLIVFLIGLGFVIAYGLEAAGIAPALATFAGLAIVGLIIISVGGILVLKGLKAFSQESMAPEKTMHTLRELRGPQAQAEAMEFKPLAEAQPEPKLSPDQLQAHIGHTRDEMKVTADEITERLSPRHMRQQARRQIEIHPYVSALIGAGTGLAGGFMLRRKIHRARA